MFSYEELVKYSDVNRKGEVPLYGILAFFQNCINLHSSEIGQDFRQMMARGKAWVLIAWKIKLERPVKIYDHIRVGTWSYGHDNIFGFRNYLLTGENGVRMAYADTKWILMDLRSRSLVRVTPENLSGYASGERIDMPACTRKIRLSGEHTVMEPVKVLKTYIDSNEHMNNVAYFRLAEEYLPEGFSYNTVDAAYVKEALEGETLIPVLYRDAEKFGISFTGPDGTVYMNMRYSKE